MRCLGSQGVWGYSFTSLTLTSCWERWNRQIYSQTHSPAPGKALSLSPAHSKDCGTSWLSLCLLKATLKRCTMWELWVKFYLGQDECCSQGDSPSDSSERLLQSYGGRSLWMILVKECVLCCAKSLQLCPTLQDTMDCSSPGSFVLGFLQTRIVKWVAISYSRGSSQPRDWTCVSYTGRWVLYH